MHGCIFAQYLTSKVVLDLKDDDIYWCTADPGWVTGTSYGIIGPWALGATQVVLDAGFSSRPLVRDDREAPHHRLVLGADGHPHADEGRLEPVKQARPDEPAPPVQRRRAAQPRGRALGPRGVRPLVPRHLLADRDRLRSWSPTCPACRSSPAAWASRSRRSPPRWSSRRPASRSPRPAASGLIAIKPPWPSMMRTYWNNTATYYGKFLNGWYICGDRASIDADGYFWFCGRDDDVINTGGPPGRAVRDRERAARAPGGGRVGGHRQARPGEHGGGEGLRGAAGRASRRARTSSSRS